MMDPDESDGGEEMQDDRVGEENDRVGEEEEEVEFVREGLSRPVLECIDLVSDDETSHHHGGAGSGSGSGVEDRVAVTLDRLARQGGAGSGSGSSGVEDRVTVTLDRLARRVEVEKRRQAEKSKAFQDKLKCQRAHGLQELALNKDRPGANAAKLCVNQWLSMPGLMPGNVSSSRRPVSRPKGAGPINSGPITCPVMRCNRTFDNQHLLIGHLKRYDHSPCDPAISLHGVCDNTYVLCLVCQQRFTTTGEYTAHLSAKVKLADGHHQSLPPLVIQCFACPACFLLFNQREECVKHMSADDHFVRSIKLGGENGVARPIPFPSYAKRVLVALCKDVPFQVVCTSCRCELRSHVEVTAHFRTLCRNAGPVCVSEKSIADVASVFQLKAFCLTCKQGLNSDTHMAKHAARTGHTAKPVTSIEESILAFCYLNEGTKTPSDFCLSAASARLKHCSLKRSLTSADGGGVQSKRAKESETEDGVKREGGVTVNAWFCECSQRFPTEKTAEKHIMAANQISHKCMVCGKLADDPAIIRLHMCRIHGGARLDSFHFWCQLCATELARIENVFVHIIDCHGGHSFYYEREVPEESAMSTEMEVMSEVPGGEPSSEVPGGEQSLPEGEGSWQCHICEEMFDTEEAVMDHCKSPSIHQFHKYACGTCQMKFHKMETLLRHSQLQHNGDIRLKYFCGLCKDLYLNEEEAFQGHYESFHSLDYSYVPNPGRADVKLPDATSRGEELTCGCLAKYSFKGQKKAAVKRCLEKLFRKGKIWYSCSSCPATAQTINVITAHVCKTAQTDDRKMAVKCSVCSKSFAEAEAAQTHYHMKHSFLKETSATYNFTPTGSNKDMFRFTASGTSARQPQARTKPNRVRASHAEDRRSTASLKAKPNRVPASHAEDRSSTASLKAKPNRVPASHAEGRSSTASPDTNTSQKGAAAEAMEIQSTDTEPQNCDLPDLDFLRTMTHIVFIDLDNWCQFFSSLPGFLNQGTFVWGFQGGKTAWKPPVSCKFFKHLSNTGCFFLHPRCSDRKDAADFAICMHAGRLDERLPKQIPFTVLSGDKGFIELENQFRKTQRPAHILNPHHMGGDIMYALLNSIAETTTEPRDEDMEINSTGQEEDPDLKEAIRRSLLDM